MPLPLLCSFLLCFIFSCGIYHKTALFKGQWFLLYFSHIPSPNTTCLISFTFFHFFVMCVLTTFPFLCHVLLYVSPFLLTLPILPVCGLLVLIGSLIALDPVSFFIYSYSTVMYPYMAFSWTLKMVAAGFSETLVPICQTTPYHISEDYNLEFHVSKTSNCTW
jgi:hypothetical protein